MVAIICGVIKQNTLKVNQNQKEIAFGKKAW